MSKTDSAANLRVIDAADAAEREAEITPEEKRVGKTRSDIKKLTSVEPAKIIRAIKRHIDPEDLNDLGDYCNTLEEEGIVEVVTGERGKKKVVPVEGVEGSEEIAAALDAKIRELVKKMKAEQQKTEEAKHDEPQETRPEKSITTEIIETIEGYTEMGELAAFFNICKKGGRVSLIKKDGKKKAAPVEGVEGSEEIAAAFNRQFNVLAKEQRENEHLKGRIAEIKKTLSEKETPEQLFGYTRNFLGGKLGVVKFEKTGKGKNEWKVVATDKTGSEEVVNLVMQRKSEVERKERDAEIMEEIRKRQAAAKK